MGIIFDSEENSIFLTTFDTLTGTVNVVNKKQVMVTKTNESGFIIKNDRFTGRYYFQDVEHPQLTSLDDLIDYLLKTISHTSIKVKIDQESNDILMIEQQKTTSNLLDLLHEQQNTTEKINKLANEQETTNTNLLSLNDIIVKGQQDTASNTISLIDKQKIGNDNLKLLVNYFNTETNTQINEINSNLLALINEQQDTNSNLSNLLVKITDKNDFRVHCNSYRHFGYTRSNEK